MGSPLVPWLKERASFFRKTLGDGYTEAFVFSHDGSLKKILPSERANHFLRRRWEVTHQATMGRELTFHSLRRWFNTRALVLSGNNEFLVGMLMGHRKEENMTARYNSANRDSLREWTETKLPLLFGTDGEFLKNEVKPALTLGTYDDE
jgi:integrase